MYYVYILENEVRCHKDAYLRERQIKKYKGGEAFKELLAKGRSNG
jgi:hypothetical protein